jgi:transcriptional regulator GlxA family with amidase domain
MFCEQSSIPGRARSGSNTTRANNQYRIPQEGIWLRLAQTFEVTVLRSHRAKQLLSPQQVLVNLRHCTRADITMLQTALERLYQTRGQVRMPTLAACCGLSLRQFERRFKLRIGASPKVFARLLRFEASRDALLQEPIPSLADVAYQFGYQDQAHVVREFRTWANCTPGTFIAHALQRRNTAHYLLPDPRPPYRPSFVL